MIYPYFFMFLNMLKKTILYILIIPFDGCFFIAEKSAHILAIIFNKTKKTFHWKNSIEIWFRIFSSVYSEYIKKNADLERIVKIGYLRSSFIKAIGTWYDQSIIQNEIPKKIGFVGIFGNQANFSKAFFECVPTGMQVYLYDLIRINPRNLILEPGTEMFNDSKKITYWKTPQLKPYHISTKNYDRVISKINNDKLDILVWATGTYAMPILDFMKTPVIIPFNTNGLLLPHSKCKIQMFVQHPWPYTIKNKKVLNLESKKTLKTPLVYDAFLFNPRGTALCWPKLFKSRKKQLFFAGNLRKLYSGGFGKVIGIVLRKNPEYKLVYYGNMDSENKKQIESYLFREKIVRQAEYRGLYSVNYNKYGQIIENGTICQAMNDLFDSRLFMNTFPISGARSAIEGYFARVPVVHMAADDNNWLENRHYVPFRIPSILTPTGTASSLEEYVAKCLQILSNDDFAQTIIKEQHVILRKVANPKRFWLKLLDLYEVARKMETIT